MIKEANIFARLTRKFPSVDEKHLSALADVWSIECDKTIKRMLEICRDEVGPVMSIEARSKARFELAKLKLWLEDQIISEKTRNVSIEHINPDRERMALDTTVVQERIENRARICADNKWKRFFNDWHQRFPLITGPQDQHHQRSGSLALFRGESPGVRNQHYSPVFSNKYWATGPENLIRVYFRSVDQGIKSRDQGYKTWGREAFLYSQSLERLFSLIEGDAKVPYTKLLDTIPLSEKERRFWIAFLITQLLRTPSFVRKHIASLREFILNREIEFPTDTASLRRLYETLFTNNDVFAGFYRLITAYQWNLWSAPPAGQFIRSDDPVLIRGSVEHGSWQLIYPMTPGWCFVAGPDKENESTAIVPEKRQLDDPQLQILNRWLAKSARRSVIACPMQDDSQLRVLLEDALGKRLSSSCREELFPEFWGPLA